MGGPRPRRRRRPAHRRGPRADAPRLAAGARRVARHDRPGRGARRGRGPPRRRRRRRASSASTPATCAPSRSTARRSRRLAPPSPTTSSGSPSPASAAPHDVLEYARGRRRRRCSSARPWSTGGDPRRQRSAVTRRARSRVRATTSAPARRAADRVRRVTTRAGFGKFGGRFVPEALVAALDELDEVRLKAMADPEFVAELERLHRTYTGRPSILTEVPRFAEHAGGARVLLKREDLNHTGSHKINNVLGQALLTKRMGKTRVIAETGAGQHGVATATAAALLGLECTVYMGEEDTRAAGPQRRPDAAARRRGRPGHHRQPDPQGRHQRGDARLGHQRRRHPLPARHRRRPAPVPGDGPRLPPGHRRSRRARRCSSWSAGCPDAVARLRRRRLQRDGHLPPRSSTTRGVRLVGLEAGGEGVASGRHAARIAGGIPGRPARRRSPTSCRTRTARPSSPTRSRPASTTRASARSTPGCTTSAARSTARSPTTQAMEAFRLLCRTEGIIPAIESAHALAGAMRGRPRARPRRPSCWSTSPAAATRTSTPPRAGSGCSTARPPPEEPARQGDGGCQA